MGKNMQRMQYHIAGQTVISDIMAQSYSKIRICGWNEVFFFINSICLELAQGNSSSKTDFRQ